MSDKHCHGHGSDKNITCTSNTTDENKSLLLSHFFASIFFQFACTCLYSDDWADLCRMLGLVVLHLKQFFSGMNQNVFVEMTICCAGEVTSPTTR